MYRSVSKVLLVGVLEQMHANDELSFNNYRFGQN